MEFAVKGNDLCTLELILLVSTEFGNSTPKTLQGRHLLTARLEAFIVMTGSKCHTVLNVQYLFLSSFCANLNELTNTSHGAYLCQ